MAPHQTLATLAPDPCPDQVAQLTQRLQEYLPPEQIERVRLAYRVGAAAHEGQVRKSGEPYITHPIAVATLLADMGMDTETLCAALEELTQQGELSRNAKGYQLNLAFPVSRPIDPQGNGNGKRSDFVQ